MDSELFAKEVDSIVSDLSETLKQKNKSYGSSSFADGDIWDVVFNTGRIHDKVSRLKFLVKTMLDSKEQIAPFGESIDDTLKDLFGYAVIGLIINRYSLKNEE